MTQAAETAVPFNGASPSDLLWLSNLADANRYIAAQAIDAGRYAAICPFVFSVAIIVGDFGDDYGYSDRWCFNSFLLAAAALTEWAGRNFEGEPIGWHRHPDTGRRRPDGDASKEYVSF